MWLGRNADAAELLENTANRLTAKLGPDHPGTLLARDNLAVTYVTIGRHADAPKLREATLAMYEAQLGPDHPNTLTAQNNLAADLLDRWANWIVQSRFSRKPAVGRKPSSAPTIPTRSCAWRMDEEITAAWAGCRRAIRLLEQVDRAKARQGRSPPVRYIPHTLAGAYAGATRWPTTSRFAGTPIDEPAAN